MSKKIKVLCVSTLLFIILGLKISSAIAVTDDSEFFYTNKQEIAQGETLEITLDISKVKYDDFEFQLASNLNDGDIITSEDVAAENKDNVLSIQISKSQVNFDKVILYYQIPENAMVGSEIEMLAQIIVGVESSTQNENVNETQSGVENGVQNEQLNSAVADNNNQNAKVEYSVVESKEVSVKIVEKEKNNNFTGADKTNTSGNKSMPTNSGTMQNITYSANTISYSNSSIQTTETAVYKGSNNNYLSSLEIEGETLNTTFNKENTTYFIETSGKTELNINANKEDSSAKVYITGNSNLKTGDNKILISVTAENGDVRYYRVFVTNN